VDWVCSLYFLAICRCRIFSPATTDNLRLKNKPTDLMAKQRIIVSVAERQLRRRERRAVLVGFIAGMAVTVALFVLFR
tara:strand:+ start:229 stop:462 length:234 start_codon:yes stop_codon:yes gene_type:complete